MANKFGLDYFNIDVDFFNDPKIIKLSKRYGPLGVMCYLITLISVYQKGYFLEACVDDLAHILLNTIGGKYVSGKYRLQEIILYLAEIDLIDKASLENHVITSRGIQKRFVLMTKNRKDQDYTKYWLIKPVVKATKAKAKEELVIEDDHQHLDKEQKKRIKRKEQIKKKIQEQGPNKHYLTSCLINYKYIDDYDL
ncbi:MAG: Lin1244/Lin1753 domain-containing protein, partial [Candidatus Izemoplasmataceae bacterium]